MVENNNQNAIMQPLRQARRPDDDFMGFFFNCHFTVYALQMCLAAIIFIFLLFNENFSFSPLPMVYICFLGNMFCLNKHVHNVREHPVVAQRWMSAGAVILLVSGSAYPLFLHATTLPRFWMIFAWVVFGLHFPITVLLNWGLRKIWSSLCQKAAHTKPPEMLGLFNYPFPPRDA